MTDSEDDFEIGFVESLNTRPSTSYTMVSPWGDFQINVFNDPLIDKEAYDRKEIIERKKYGRLCRSNTILNIEQVDEFFCDHKMGYLCEQIEFEIIENYPWLVVYPDYCDYPKSYFRLLYI